MRLDLYLVNNNYFKTRTKAQNEIKAGNVLVDSKKILKPNFDYVSGNIEILDKLKYVSRGGLKLEGAINYFNLDFNNKTVLDIGSSTGGFTDCALQHGALTVYSVDVGTDQMDEQLRKDSRIHLFENTNINDTNFDVKFDFLVMDVSFVSIDNILDSLLKYIEDDTIFICLIKPQFEVGKMLNKGVIKDSKIHKQVLDKVNADFNRRGLYINKLEPSPIHGGSGNIEFLAYVTRNNKSYIDFKEVVKKAHEKSD